MNIKRSLIIGTAVAIASAGSLGAASMVSATESPGATDTGNTSIIDKIASRFNLDKNEVQAVFDEEHQARETEREAHEKQMLDKAVSSGKLTQAQADHIAQVMSEIRALHNEAEPGRLTSDALDQIKSKMDALHDWAEANNIDVPFMKINKGYHHHSFDVSGPDSMSAGPGSGPRVPMDMGM